MCAQDVRHIVWGEHVTVSSSCWWRMRGYIITSEAIQFKIIPSLIRMAILHPTHFCRIIELKKQIFYTILHPILVGCIWGEGGGHGFLGLVLHP